jgi:hypothetical protein
MEKIIIAEQKRREATEQKRQSGKKKSQWKFW